VGQFQNCGPLEVADRQHREAIAAFSVERLEWPLIPTRGLLTLLSVEGLEGLGDQGASLLEGQNVIVVCQLER